MINNEVKLFSANTAKSKQRAIIYFIGLIVVVILQTIHYTLYYKQPLQRSLIWSFVDWSIWLMLFYILFKLKSKLKIRKYSIGKKIGVISGIMAILILFQTLGATAVFYLIFGLDLPVFDDVSKHLTKRWFQNLLIAGCLYFLFDLLHKKYNSTALADHSLEDEQPLVFRDGTTIYQLLPSDIKWAISVKNYVNIHTKEKQILIRATLNSVIQLLEPYDFIKISRSTIIRKDLIFKIQKKSEYRHILISRTGEEFAIGRTYLKSVKENTSSSIH